MFAWLGTVYAAYTTAAAAVNAATTPAQALAVQLGSVAAPPAVTIQGATAINN